MLDYPGSPSLKPSTTKTFKSGPGNGYQRSYQFVHSANLVADKNFYWLTVIDATPAVQKLITGDPTFRTIHDRRLALLKSHASDTCSWASSLVTDFRYTLADSTEISTTLQTLYRNNKTSFDALVDNHLRPSGYYERWIALNNEDLLLHAWGQTVVGINYIIDQFGLGKKMRYPLIDSASYDVDSRYYRTVLKDLFAYLGEQEAGMTTFYHPSLAVALQLMDVNDRDEPARFEPMETTENQAAIQKIGRIDWNKYKYATIVIPGNGPVLTSTPISPDNKLHCSIAAMRYKNNWAPFIIVSGGYCYPFRGPYCEAIEMKKFLMTRFGIPAYAIIIDPHARHTTTNIRNADRLMIRYGIPITKQSVFVTTQSQTSYSAAATFDQRNLRELGYLPYRDKQQISIHDITFYPVMESLHMDPYDPLDP
ncbi:MAG: YdcF family protein [Bacteroidetes bacterium]|nr:YdcF family protein [Bacteroidota bacterium]